jgi:hypothetical protein
MRLSHHVYDGVLRILPSLYACGTMREFTMRVVGLLPSLIEADGYGWFVHSFGPRPGLVDFVESEPRIITTAMVSRMGETAHSHPFSSHWANAKEISTLKLSDFPLLVRDRFLSENWDILPYRQRAHNFWQRRDPNRVLCKLHGHRAAVERDDPIGDAHLEQQ